MATIPIINLGHPLLRGAMLWWLTMPTRMGGSMMVDLLNCAPGMFVGKPTWSGAQGRIGGKASVTLDGTTYAKATTPAVSYITLAAWVKVTSDTTGQEVLSNTSDTTLMRVYNGAGFGAVFYVVVGASYYGAYQVANLGTGWRHLVGTYDGDTVCLYVDGIITANSEPAPSGPIDASANNLLVGVHSGLASYHYTGAIDDIVKWNRALSAAEVQQWYHLSRQRYVGVVASRSRTSISQNIAAITLSGVVGTTATGTVSTTAVFSRALTGQLLTASRGLLSGATSAPVAGKFATTTIGSVVIAILNVQSVANQFRVDLLNGLHAFGPSVIRAATTKDTFKVALYVTTATRGAADTVYNATGEVSGTNYVAGGVAVTNATVPTLTGSTAYWTPSASVVFTNVTLSTAFDCMLLYNSTSTAKLAVAVFIFGAQVVTAGDFTLVMPPNNATTGLVRLT